MTNYIQDSHAAIFTGPTSCRKSDLVLDFIEKQYDSRFHYIIITCQKLWWNKVYRNKVWKRHDDNAWLTEPKDKPYKWIERLSLLLERSEVLLIIYNTLL